MKDAPYRDPVDGRLLTVNVGPGYCVDCGKPTSGLRCNTCHGAYIRLQALKETAARDRELLELVDGGPEHVTYQSLATRWNVSRERVKQKVHRAREREEARRALAI